MENISFSIAKDDDGNGQMVDCLIKITEKETEKGVVVEKEVWTTIPDLDRLFDACVRRWGSNWNLEKVLIAIQESEID